MASEEKNMAVELIDAERVKPLLSTAMKEQVAPSDFVMACCFSPAVLKTSGRGLHFFARQNDECPTAPETAWHIEGKRAVMDAMPQLGLQCLDEHSRVSRLGSAIFR